MKRFLFISFLGFCLLLSSCGKRCGSSLHFDADSARVLIENAIQDSLIPGAVLCVVDGGKIIHLEAYGYRAIVPEHEVMTTNTIFDLASVSKPTGAGTAALMLVKEGKLSVDDLVCKYIPNYHPDVTVRHLMTHYSGLPAYFIASPMERIYLERLGDGVDTEQARRDFTVDSIARSRVASV